MDILRPFKNNSGFYVVYASQAEEKHKHEMQMIWNTSTFLEGQKTKNKVY